MKLEQVKRNINQLSEKDKAALAQWFITNLDEVYEDESTINAAWRREIRTRIDAIKAGKVDMIASEKMWKDLLFDYGKTN